MSTITTKDGVSIYYKDWNPQSTKSQTFVFSHGWPLNSDAWEDQMIYLADQGYRVVAHDRRGHGRSDQPWTGNEMDTYADDLSQLIEKLDLKNIILVGHSTGGGEVAHYTGRYGTSRVSGLVLVGAVTPSMAKTSNNPNGLPMSVFDGLRETLVKDRSQMFKDFSVPFFNADKPGSNVSQGMRDTFWLLGMQASYKSLYDCIKAFSETDFTADLQKVDVPTMIVHGDADQIVPIDTTARLAATMVKGSTLNIYEGASHAIPATHKDRLNADLKSFAESIATASQKAA